MGRAHSFLSDGWFSAVEGLRAGAPPTPDAAMDVSIDLVVTGAPDGQVEAHLTNGLVDRGLIEAPTLVTMPYDVAKELFVSADPGKVMVAVLDGTVTVEGDPSGLMSLQSAAASPTPEQLAFQKKVQALTR